MMRIAVAGTGGLARLIAHYIDQETGHHVVFLSRGVRHPLLLIPSKDLEQSVRRQSLAVSRQARCRPSVLDIRCNRPTNTEQLSFEAEPGLTSA